MSVQYNDRTGVPKDEMLHEPILSAVDFNSSPAYANAVERFIALGLTAAEAKELMRPTDALK